MDEWLLRRKLSDILHEYDPDKYNPEDLLLVRKYCEPLYSEFMFRERFPSQMEAAKSDCLHYLSHFDDFFRAELSEQDLSRLKNELSYIRLVLDV